MATRARSQGASPRARRRPARRPAPRRGGSRIRWDRVGRIALTLVLAAVLYSYLNPAIDLVKTYSATSAAKAQLHELMRENRRLHDEIHGAGNPLTIEREARAQGMVVPGETPVVVRGLNG